MLALFSTPARMAFSAGVLTVSVAGIAGLTSAALFSDEADLTGNTFETGSVTLNTTDLSSGTWSAAIDNMQIGSASNRPIKVTNDGSLAGTFTITEAGGATDSTALGAALQADLTKDACTVSPGTSLYSGDLSDLAVSTGEALGAASSVDLCLRVTLPSTGTDAGDNALQDASYSSTLTFTLTQNS